MLWAGVATLVSLFVCLGTLQWAFELSYRKAKPYLIGGEPPSFWSRSWVGLDSSRYTMEATPFLLRGWRIYQIQGLILIVIFASTAVTFGGGPVLMIFGVYAGIGVVMLVRGQYKYTRIGRLGPERSGVDRTSGA